MSSQPTVLPLVERSKFHIPVIIESPFAGASSGSIARNLRYARMAMRDSISRGESPLASHLLYTQDGILLDTIPEERRLGISLGYTWMALASKVIFYTDLGMSPGMAFALQAAESLGIPTEFRSIIGARKGLNPAPDKA